MTETDDFASFSKELDQKWAQARKREAELRVFQQDLDAKEIELRDTQSTQARRLRDLLEQNEGLKEKLRVASKEEAQLNEYNFLGKDLCLQMRVSTDEEVATVALKEKQRAQVLSVMGNRGYKPILFERTPDRVILTFVRADVVPKYMVGQFVDSSMGG